MDQIRINITVTIATDDRLAKVLEALAGSQPRLAEPKAVLPKQAEPDADAGAMACNDMPFDEPTEAPTETAEAPTEAAPKKGDKDTILEIIDRTRKRIQGEDYETNSSPENKKLQRMLTAEFKNIAMTLAASFGKQDELIEKDKNGNDIVKPSRLPEIGAEVAFARSCDELELVDGEIVSRTKF